MHKIPLMNGAISLRLCFKYQTTQEADPHNPATSAIAKLTVNNNFMISMKATLQTQANARASR